MQIKDSSKFKINSLTRDIDESADVFNLAKLLFVSYRLALHCSDLPESFILLQYKIQMPIKDYVPSETLEWDISTLSRFAISLSISFFNFYMQVTVVVCRFDSRPFFVSFELKFSVTQHSTLCPVVYSLYTSHTNTNIITLKHFSFSPQSRFKMLRSKLSLHSASVLQQKHT